MTKKQIWDFMKAEPGDGLADRIVAEVAEELNDVEVYVALGILSAKATAMSELPRNKMFPAKLQNGWDVMSIVYGTGSDDFLALILAHRGHLEFVVWMANFDVGPQSGDCVAVGNGDYFTIRPKDEGSSTALVDAWAKFEERSRSLRAYYLLKR